MLDHLIAHSYLRVGRSLVQLQVLAVEQCVHHLQAMMALMQRIHTPDPNRVQGLPEVFGGGARPPESTANASDFILG